MFSDADDRPQDEPITTDVCIVGAGAAGITLARSFIGSRHRVCLLESGDLEFDAATQDLYAGEIGGQDTPALDVSRLRFFGGTTNHWGGFCRPLDEIDFEKRAYIPNSGWPFSRSELEPYYQFAQTICEIGPFAYEAPTWTDEVRVPLDFNQDVVDSSPVFQASPPTRFGQVYRTELAKADNVSIILNANVVEIETADNVQQVTGLRVASLNGARFPVKSRFYILATGAVENARILLNSNSLETAGLGNRYDRVGRFFMDHPKISTSGTILFTRNAPPLDFYHNRVVDGIKIKGFFALPSEGQRKEELLNCGILIEPEEKRVRSPAVASLRVMLEDLRRGKLPDRFAEHLERVVVDFDDVLYAGYRRAFDPQPLRFTTSFWTECPPDSESRVSLIAARDALGLQRVQVDWRMPADLKRTYTRMHELLGAEIGRAGIGRLQVLHAEDDDDPRAVAETSYHHMGTTRMHPDPKQGVVDQDCRVHGLANLFIAGSSVFPTYGHANPTLTIVALSLRLAEHIKRQISEVSR